MGLDMYLNRRKKLTKEEERGIVLFRKRIDELTKKNDKEYEKYYRQAREKYKTSEAKTFEEMIELRDNVDEYIKEHLSDEFKKNRKAIDTIDEDIQKMYQCKEVGYWRKHADLNNYFENLYIERGGKEEFNCVELFLSKEDCEEVLNIAEKILNDEMEIEQGSGFFWGATTKEDWKDTIDIFTQVLETTDFENEEIYYSCWW